MSVVDKSKAFEVDDNGLLVGAAHIASGPGVPIYSGNKGDLWINTTNGKLYQLKNDDINWVEVGKTGSPNLDGGLPNSNYGGIDPVDGGGV